MTKETEGVIGPEALELIARAWREGRQDDLEYQYNGDAWVSHCNWSPTAVIRGYVRIRLKPKPITFDLSVARAYPDRVRTRNGEKPVDFHIWPDDVVTYRDAGGSFIDLRPDGRRYPNEENYLDLITLPADEPEVNVARLRRWFENMTSRQSYEVKRNKHQDQDDG